MSNANKVTDLETISKNKKITLNDLKMLPLDSPCLKKLENSYNAKKPIICYGKAGTGKTINPMALALRDALDVSNHHIDKLVIIRSCVPVRNRGFEKGDSDDKDAPYKKPYIYACNKLFGRNDAYGWLEHNGYVEFHSTSYIQGITLENAIVFVDEAANLNYDELYACATRLGENSRLIVSGDTYQNYLIHNKKDVSGFRRFMEVMEKIPQTSFIDFSKEKSRRSQFVAAFTEADMEYRQEKNLD